MCDSGPDTPDPTSTAAAQGAENRDTAVWNTNLGRPNMSTPMGTVQWIRDPNDPTKQMMQSSLNGDFMDKYGQNVSNSSSSGSTSSYNNSATNTRETGIDANTLKMLEGLMPQMQKAFGSSSTPTAMGLDANQVFQGAQVNNPSLTSNIAGKAGLDAGATSVAAQAQDRLKSLYGTDLNYDNVVASPEANEAARKSVEDAMYGRQTARLDPQFQQRTSDQEAKLAAQGITQGSEAYNRETANLGRERTDAYAAARNDSITNSTSEMQKLFDMGMDARKQGVTETNTIRDQSTKEALAASQLASTAANSLQGLSGQQSANQAQSAQATAAIMNSELARNEQQFTQGNYDKESLTKLLQAMRGGQSSLSSSTSSGGSQGSQSSESGSSSYQLPGFVTGNIGSGTGGGGGGAASAGAAPIAALTQQAYEQESANASANNQAGLSAASMALMAASMFA